MPESSRQSPAASIRDEALAWFVRMNSGDASADDQARFHAWIAADPAHRRHYEKLGELWTELDSLPDPRRPDRSVSHRRISRRQMLLGSTAVVGFAAVAAPLSGLTTALAADFRTGTGERRTVTAADGTRIELDAGTAIAEEYTPMLRRLRLMEGRAAFSVAADADRPFEVVCREGICRAARGTFVVHKRADDVAVAVESGAVSVAAGSTTAEVAAGQRVAYTAQRLGAVEAMSGDAETAWRRGKLVFVDRPLNDVVADLNRYREGRIVIADRSLATLRLDGIFDTAKPEAALEAICSTLPVRAWRLTNYLVVLRRT